MKLQPPSAPLGCATGPNYGIGIYPLKKMTSNFHYFSRDKWPGAIQKIIIRITDVIINLGTE